MARLRLDDFPPAVQARIKEAMDAEDSRSRARDPQPQQAGALVAEVQRADVLDADAPRLRVTITRRSQRPLDDDNFVGGCKQLRDAIAELLGRKGDAEKDGLVWEYRQEKGEKMTIITIEEI
jgi:hypothetical protein